MSPVERDSLPAWQQQPPVEDIYSNLTDDYGGRETLAIIVRNEFNNPGHNFFTDSNRSQQLGFIKLPTKYKIEPHVHNSLPREVRITNEVLVIKKGILRVDLYNEHRGYVTSRELFPGDVILLISGGHGFEVVEDVEMIEVRQGPYSAGRDKTRFKGTSSGEVRYG